VKQNQRDTNVLFETMQTRVDDLMELSAKNTSFFSKEFKNLKRMLEEVQDGLNQAEEEEERMSPARSTHLNPPLPTQGPLHSRGIHKRSAI
jgi:hypothetical protein